MLFLRFAAALCFSPWGLLARRSLGPPPMTTNPSVTEPSTAPASSPVMELAHLLESRRGERHLVAIQDFPDPDAISSGMAYRTLAGCFGISADIVYDGQISHPEN